MPPHALPGHRRIGLHRSRLVERLVAREDTERIVIADVVPPKGGYRPKTEFGRARRARPRRRHSRPRARERRTCSSTSRSSSTRSRTRASCTTWTSTARTTCSRRRREAGVGHVLVTSSTTAYGAFPDNPVPITEDWPVRGVAAFAYARDKTESDRLCQLWALRHPERHDDRAARASCSARTWTTTCVRLWTKRRSRPTSANLDSLIQFVHEDDVVDAISGLLEGRHGGAFNVAPRRPDDDARERRGARARRSARCRCGSTAALARRAVAARPSRDAARPDRRSRCTRGSCSNEKVKATLGWQPRYTSRETFEITMRAHGKLPPAERDRPSGRPGGLRTQSYTRRLSRAVSSAGRAPARQAGGRWFEPSTAHQCR